MTEQTETSHAKAVTPREVHAALCLSSGEAKAYQHLAVAWEELSYEVQQHFILMAQGLNNIAFLVESKGWKKEGMTEEEGWKLVDELNEQEKHTEEIRKYLITLIERDAI